jgi:hypothetical protein
VPGEGIEPPTFGLQNRCSTAELTRQFRCGAYLAPRRHGRQVARLVADCAISVPQLTWPWRGGLSGTLPHQPIGVSIKRQGNLALAAHVEGEVSVLLLDRINVKLRETRCIGDEKSAVSHVASTPDGRLALGRGATATSSAALQIDDGKVTDTKRESTCSHYYWLRDTRYVIPIYHSGG